MNFRITIFILVILGFIACNRKAAQTETASSELLGMYKLGEPGQLRFAGENFVFLPKKEFTYKTYGDMMMMDKTTGRSYTKGTFYGKGMYVIEDDIITFSFRDLLEEEKLEGKYSEKFYAEGDELKYNFQGKNEKQILMKRIKSKEYSVYSLFESNE